MHQYHYLWPLFTHDIIHARFTLREMWRKNKIGKNQAAHWGLNLGDREWIGWIINMEESADNSGVNGIRFRLERTVKRQNPYTTLIKLSKEQQIDIRKRGVTDLIELSGGIGDYLEDLNILMPWLKRNRETIQIKCTQVRKNQLYSLLPDITWHTTRTESLNSMKINSKVLMAALDKDLPQPIGLLKISKKSVKLEEKNIFCCWTAAGKGDKLSRWIRSIPFVEVVRFYDEIIQSGCLAESITDCSEWKSWEEKYLMNKGIQIYRPEKGDLLELAQRVVEHKIVISIDSALVHLCAAMSKNVELMLPKYHDERWNQLIKIGSCYHVCCTIMKQASYGMWKEEMTKMASKIIHQLSREN